VAQLFIGLIDIVDEVDVYDSKDIEVV